MRSCSCNRNHDLHVDEYDNRQEPLELSLFLYDLRVIEERHVNYFTLLLNALAIEVEVVAGVTTS